MRDIFRFIGKIGLLSFAFACLTTSSFVANAQESSVTSGKIQIDNEKATTASDSSQTSGSVFRAVDSAPYKFKQGQRDPFVPFGGNVAPTPLAPNSLSNLPNAKDNKIIEKKKVDEEEKVVEEPIVLPVMVTGVLLGGNHSFAILAPAGDKDAGKASSDSFLVSVGDKVGEYTVQSITNDKVVLIWQGKPYSIPVQKYTGKSKDGKVVVGEAPVKSTLPVPQIKKKEEKKDVAEQKDSSKKDEDNSDKNVPSDKEQKNEKEAK